MPIHTIFSPKHRYCAPICDTISKWSGICDFIFVRFWIFAISLNFTSTWSIAYYLVFFVFFRSLMGIWSIDPLPATALAPWARPAKSIGSEYTYVTHPREYVTRPPGNLCHLCIMASLVTISYSSIFSKRFVSLIYVIMSFILFCFIMFSVVVFCFSRVFVLILR